MYKSHYIEEFLSKELLPLLSIVSSSNDYLLGLCIKCCLIKSNVSQDKYYNKTISLHLFS